MAKFEIGQEVAVKKGKTSNLTLHIMERQEFTCFSGTQIIYKGRVWFDDSHFPTKRWTLTSKDTMTFYEDELELLTEKPVEPD